MRDKCVTVVRVSRWSNYEPGTNVAVRKYLMGLAGLRYEWICSRMGSVIISLLWTLGGNIVSEWETDVTL